MLNTEIERHPIKGKRNVFVTLKSFTYGSTEDRWAVEFVRLHNHKGQKWESCEGGTYNLPTYRKAKEIYMKYID